MPEPKTEPTLFGIPLNRLVAFAGPYISVVAGGVVAWLIAKANVVGFPGLGTHAHELATGITAALTWLLVSVLSHLGQAKWLDGFQKWAYTQVIDAVAHEPLPLAGVAASSGNSSAFFVSSHMGTLGDDDPDDFGKDGDELPPEAAEFEEADPRKIPADIGDGETAAEVQGSSALIAPDPAGAEALGPLTASASGLSYKHRIRARDLVVQAAFLGLRHARELHYTQSASRWEGIKNHLKAWRKQFPKHADCSSFATWCLWQGLDHYGVRDLVNGAHWKYGYTGTMVKRGKRVVHEHNIMRGDLALYGDPFGGSGHVAVCIGGGKVISFGSEAGPFLLDLHYRSDLRQVRRYI
ncbi:MAG: hypothetical protein ABW167_19545 [Baekduia sp.]